MKTSTRFAILGASAALCAAGVLNSGSEKIASCDFSIEEIDIHVPSDGYQFAASRTPKLTFQQLEKIVRRDAVAKSQPGRIEFGSLKMKNGTALAEVMFVNNERVTPFLYTLEPERDSWKIVNVQRVWFVPRSRLLRGVRA